MKYLFITIALLNVPLFSMEPVDERAPLLAQKRIVMDDMQEIANAPNILCTGSRQYFDSATQRKVECHQCTECMWEANLKAILLSPVGAANAGFVPLMMWTCCNKTSGCIFAGGCGMAAEWMIPGCLVVYGIGLCAANCEYNMYGPKIKPNDLHWIHKLQVPQILLNTASATKIIPLDHSEYENFKYLLTHEPRLSEQEREEKNKIKRTGCIHCFPTLKECYRLFTRFTSTRSKILSTFLNKPNRASLIELQLAHDLHKEKKIPKPVVQIIFNFADLKRHRYCVTEKEFVYLLDGLSNKPNQPRNYPKVCLDYARQILLAHHGWCSFSQSEKFPIPACLRYLDRYIALDGPRLYLPYCPKLAAYYRFEDDPVYQGGNIRESSEQIKHLLELRAQFIKSE